MKRYLTIIFTALILAGCADVSIDEVLLSSSDVSVSLKGKVLYTFNPDKAQAAYDRENNLYRYSAFIFTEHISGSKHSK